MAHQFSINDKINFILVEPQMAENIGASARVMLNFGFENLRLISPRAPYEVEKAKSMAAGAEKLLEKPLFQDFEECTKDFTYLYALSARPRWMNKPSLPSSNLLSDIQEKLKAGHNIGLLFGKERTGLENHQIAKSDQIIYIESNPEFSSLNLAQSVAVIAYELKSLYDNKLAFPESPLELSTQEELEEFMKYLESELDRSNFYSVDEKKERMINNIYSLFKRITNLSKQDVKTLYGILKAIKRS